MSSVFPPRAFHSVATITYIFDDGILVDFALQVLEDALSEKSVGGHDGLMCSLWIVLFWDGVVGVLDLKSLVVSRICT
jgi:hypothetical protein